VPLEEHGAGVTIAEDVGEEPLADGDQLALDLWPGRIGVNTLAAADDAPDDGRRARPGRGERLRASYAPRFRSR
jgi:hypothetical protein